MRTNLGDIELIRQPSGSEQFMSRASSLEVWELLLSGESKMTVGDAAAPGISMQKQMKSGLRGEILGEEFTASAKRSLRAAARTVEFQFPNELKRFRARRYRELVSVAPNTDPEILAKEARDGWVVNEEKEEDVLLLAFFVIADLDYFLESPLGDILPI
jgi:hypothetical protein